MCVVLKTVVVAVMIFVAFSARQFVSQRLNRAQQMSVPLADRLRRAFGAEAAIGVVVLALSAWLLAFVPPNIDDAPTVDYAITQTHTDEAGILDVRIRLTDDQIGLVGLEVEVREPEENLAGLVVVFTAPPNDQNVGSIRQPVPLTGAGFAVRDEAIGLPISVAGNWTIQVEANTASGVVSSTAADLHGVQSRRQFTDHGGHAPTDEPRRSGPDRTRRHRRLTAPLRHSGGS